MKYKILGNLTDEGRIKDVAILMQRVLDEIVHRKVTTNKELDEIISSETKNKTEQDMIRRSIKELGMKFK